MTVMVLLAVWVKAGMPRSTVVAWRVASSSIWVSCGGCGGEADFESFGFAGPALLLGLGDAVAQVVADPGQVGPLGWVGPQEGAADAAVLVDAAGPVGAAAVAERDPAALEMAEELLPFGVGGGAVFLAGAQGPAAGDECPVTVDDLFGVDGLVSHRGVDVAVAGHELGDVRRHPVHDRVGDQQPAEIVGRELERLASGVGEPGGCQGDVEQLTDGLGGDRTVFCAQAALEQQRHRRVPLALVVVVGNHQGERSPVRRGSG